MRTARHTARVVATVASMLAALACAKEVPTAATISGEELAQRIAAGTAPAILDVRTAEEFAAGHLPGARNIPHDALADRLGELDLAADQELVVHCHSGRRAAVAEQVLKEAGYARIRDLEGHWLGWQAAGLPTE